MMIKAEQILHQQVCDYLKLQYPTVIFRSDHEGGRKRHPVEQARIKRLNSGRAWPDLFIAEPTTLWKALFIELKAVEIYTQKGYLKADPHLREQEEMLDRLQQKGYKAVFAVGFDQAQSIIDKYLAHLKLTPKDTGSVF